MGRRGKETSKKERATIIRLHNKCKRLSEISMIVNRGKSTIKRMIDRYGERKSNENLRRSGRQRKINEYSGRAMIRKIKKDPHISAAELQYDLGISVCNSTIRNCLRSSECLGRIDHRKYYISKVNKSKRLDFAEINLNRTECFSLMKVRSIYFNLMGEVYCGEKKILNWKRKIFVPQ